MHQKLFWVWSNGQAVGVNKIRVPLIIPSLERALVLGQRGVGVEPMMGGKDYVVNPEKNFPPASKLIYLLRIALVFTNALGEGNPPIRPRRAIERTK